MRSPREVHLEYFEALVGQDWAKLRDLLHADYIYRMGDGQELRGIEAGVSVAKSFVTAFPDLHIAITKLHVTPDSSIAQMVVTATHVDLGKPANGRGVDVCSIIEVKDGKIYREREYFDPAQTWRFSHRFWIASRWNTY